MTHVYTHRWRADCLSELLKLYRLISPRVVSLPVVHDHVSCRLESTENVTISTQQILPVSGLCDATEWTSYHLHRVIDQCGLVEESRDASNCKYLSTHFIASSSLWHVCCAVAGHALAVMTSWLSSLYRANPARVVDTGPVPWSMEARQPIIERGPLWRLLGISNISVYKIRCKL